MSSAYQNLSAFNADEMPLATGMKIAIVTAEWNKEITHNLREGAIKTIKDAGGAEGNIYCVDVPGSFELTAAAAMLANEKKFDVIICLGCVIQGETRHFEFICNAVANGLSNISIQHNMPVIFGVLTTDTFLQATERSGGKHGNKGVEAAVTALKMAALKRKLAD
jgi:6,7-dimethyl-8-ribityllumazine synthase